MSAHNLNWFRKLLYEWSCHTSIEEALRSARANGKRAGHGYCPRCEITRLIEIEPGLFSCPYCKMDTDAAIHLNIPVRTGALMRAYPFKTDTRQIEAIRAKNGPEYQKRLTQRLHYQPEGEQ